MTGGPFLILEFVDGEPLSARIKREGALAEDEALHLMRGLLSALKYAHEQAVLHRDIKPGNVLLTRDGEPKLVDFGLARMGGESQMTEIGTSMGTTAYASPEQMNDASRVDQRSDVYSLGATFYEMLTGESPLSFVEEEIPQSLRTVVVKAMERDREQRWQSAAEFLDALTAVSEGRGLRVSTRTTGSAVENGDCPRCGRRNGDEPRFCLDCGSSLYEPCLVCGKPTATGFRHCQKCGADQEAAVQKANEELTANVATAQQDAAWGCRGDAFRAIEQAGQREGFWIADVAAAAQKHLGDLEAACQEGDSQRQALTAQVKGYQNAGDYRAVLRTLRPLIETLTGQWPAPKKSFDWALGVEAKVAELVNDIENRLVTRAPYKLLDPGPKALHARLRSDLDDLSLLDATEADRLSDGLAAACREDEERRDAVATRIHGLQDEGDYKGVLEELEAVPGFLIGAVRELVAARAWALRVAGRVKTLLSEAEGEFLERHRDRVSEPDLSPLRRLIVPLTSSDTLLDSPYESLEALIEEVTSLDASAGAGLVREAEARGRKHLDWGRELGAERKYALALWHVHRALELPGESSGVDALAEEIRASRRRRRMLAAGAMVASLLLAVCSAVCLHWSAVRLARLWDERTYDSLVGRVQALRSKAEAEEEAIEERLKAYGDAQALCDEFSSTRPQSAHLHKVAAEKERLGGERQALVEAEHRRSMKAAQNAYKAQHLPRASEHLSVALVLKPDDEAAKKLERQITEAEYARSHREIHVVFRKYDPNHPNEVSVSMPKEIRIGDRVDLVNVRGTFMVKSDHNPGRWLSVSSDQKGWKYMKHGPTVIRGRTDGEVTIVVHLSR